MRCCPSPRLVIASTLLACFGVALSGQTTRQADTIVSRDGRFSLVAAPGWGKLDPNSRGGVSPAVAGALDMAKELDMLLNGPQSSWGINASGQIVTGPATFNATHFAVRHMPKGTTLDMHRRDMIAVETDSGVWTEFRPEPATQMKIDGQDAVAWQVTKSVKGVTVKTFDVSVFVGSRLYDFHAQAGGTSDFSSVLEDVNRMLRSVKFR